MQAKTGDPSQASQALGSLCEIYWPPIFAFLRRQGKDAAEAEDLTQAFFVHLMQQQFLEHLQDQRGKFRSFLLAFLKHFLADQRDKARALKRGGDCAFVSLEALAPEVRDALAPADFLTPESAYERHWARTLLEFALERLRLEYEENGKSELFALLKDLEPGEHGPLTYAEMGSRLGLSESGVKSAVHRLRRRHQEIVREAVAQTVTRPEEIDEELRHLIQVLG